METAYSSSLHVKTWQIKRGSAQAGCSADGRPMDGALIDQEERGFI